jgi:hypothetical protein
MASCPARSKEKRMTRKIRHLIARAVVSGTATRPARESII